MFFKDLKGVKEKLCNTTEEETMKRIRESRDNWFRSQIGLVSTGQEGFFFSFRFFFFFQRSRGFGGSSEGFGGVSEN